ncbi:MAG: hypothetical protein U5K36_13675 [Roseovarius sp.]|nr:hypothetical protein [Roseovarius sp.]
MFDRAPAGIELIIRAAHDRSLGGGGRLFARVAGWPRAGMVALDLPAVPGRPARQARLAVRFGEVALAVPERARVIGSHAARSDMLMSHVRGAQTGSF